MFSKQTVFVLAGILAATNGLRIDSSNPDDVTKHFCQGFEAQTAENVIVDVECEPEFKLIDGREVEGCKSVAGGKLPVKIEIVPTTRATALTQSATSQVVGKVAVGMPGLPKVVCDGTAGECTTPGQTMHHNLDLNIPGIIPFHIKGKLAKYSIKDQDGKNVACFSLPIFIPAGIVRALRRN